MERIRVKPLAEARREVLARLTRLAATGLKLSSVARDRFAASEAYGAIVDDRVKFLQMDAIPGVPSMASFISAASHPARRRCDATRARLEKVATSAQLTAEIMRTSLTVEQQARGNENLTQLNRTAHTQLVMQHNVEGLSVAAITYYSTGVLGYLTKAAVGAEWRCPWVSRRRLRWAPSRRRWIERSRHREDETRGARGGGAAMTDEKRRAPTV